MELCLLEYIDNHRITFKLKASEFRFWSLVASQYSGLLQQVLPFELPPPVERLLADVTLERVHVPMLPSNVSLE